MSSRLGKLEPQGAPRGLLVYWMLHRISTSPTYGFEILKEIEAKSEGAWRPGPGSVYPLMKRMVQLGYVQSEGARGERGDQHLYKITKKGADHLAETREMFRLMGKRWSSLKGIFVDLIEPENLPDFVLNGLRKQFELSRELLERNRSRIPEGELHSALREYSGLLEAQQNWVSRELRQAPVMRHRGPR